MEPLKIEDRVKGYNSQPKHHCPSILYLNDMTHVDGVLYPDTAISLCIEDKNNLEKQSSIQREVLWV
jgi:hypothetical protein